MVNTLSKAISKLLANGYCIESFGEHYIIIRHSVFQILKVNQKKVLTLSSKDCKLQKTVNLIDSVNDWFVL